MAIATLLSASYHYKKTCGSAPLDKQSLKYAGILTVAFAVLATTIVVCSMALAYKKPFVHSITKPEAIATLTLLGSMDLLVAGIATRLFGNKS